MDTLPQVADQTKNHDSKNKKQLKKYQPSPINVTGIPDFNKIQQLLKLVAKNE